MTHPFEDILRRKGFLPDTGTPLQSKAKWSTVHSSRGVEILCKQPHSGKLDGKWHYSPGSKLGLLIQGNGVETYYLYCPVCGQKTGHIPKTMSAKLLAGGHLPERVHVNTPIDYPPCSYRGCQQPGKDWHHFAPRNTFIDADNWPVMPLCQDHHRTWHQEMDGYLWTAKTVASADTVDYLLPHFIEVRW